MTELHGIIYAYLASPGMGELVTRRTCASLPFCSRYRMIDFSLSALVNAGARGVGVIMQRDYQSLLDHLKGGRDWSMDRSRGGLRLLPPFGLSDSHHGDYKGNMEALFAVKSYIEGITGENIVLCRGDLLANIDFSAALKYHLQSGAEITAVVTKNQLSGKHHCFLSDDNGFATEFLIDRYGKTPGVSSLEAYFLSKTYLLELIDTCLASNNVSFHSGALFQHMSRGGKVALYEHTGYACVINTIGDYYRANMDMLNADIRSELFLPERPVHTKERAEVSTYYSETATTKNSLIADGCIIDGEVENCVIFRGVRVKKGTKLKNCIIMQDACIDEHATMAYTISDKDVVVSKYSTLAGSPRLPLVIPKGCKI